MSKWDGAAKQRAVFFWIALVAAFLSGFVLFRQGSEYLHYAGRFAVLWAVFHFGFFLEERKGRTFPGTMAMSLAGALVLSAFPFEEFHQSTRFIAPILLFWLVYYPALRWRAIVAQWKAAAALVGGLIAAFALLLFIGPLLLTDILAPAMPLDPTHRLLPKEGEADAMVNEDGLIHTMPANVFNEDSLNIIFVGDSFTAGYRKPEPDAPAFFNDSFPFVVGHALQGDVVGRPVNVANFGWTGTSPVLQARELKNLGPKYHPDIVVQALDMTDFREDLIFTRLLGEKKDSAPQPLTFKRMLSIQVSRWVFGLSRYDQWLAEQFRFGSDKDQHIPGNRFFAMGQPLDQSSAQMETTWKAILETQKTSVSMGAKYLLVILPRYPQYNPAESPRDWEKGDWPVEQKYLLEPFKYFDEKTNEADFPIFSLLDTFRQNEVVPTCFLDDPHWNQIGHEVAGKAIAQEIKRLGWLPDSPLLTQ